MGMDRHGTFCPSSMAGLSISAGLVLYFKETHYFCRFKSWWNQCFLVSNFCHLKHTLKTESSLTNPLFIF